MDLIYGTIENCINYGNITGAKQVGGIAGDLDGVYEKGTDTIAMIKSCINYGNIIANKTTESGGITGCGFKNSVIDSCQNFGLVSVATYYCGGITGTSFGQVVNCSNSGNIKSNQDRNVNADSNVGGIAGAMAVGTDLIKSEVKNCKNDGEIYGECKGIGGIAGRSWANTEVEKCYNSGNIKGEAFGIGGIVGIARGTVSKSYNKGIIGTQDTLGCEIGGVVGCLPSTGIIQYCFNSGKVTGYNKVGGITGRTVIEKSVYSQISESYTYGDVSLATGANSTTSKIGVLIGENTTKKISKCYYLKLDNLQGIYSCDDVNDSFEGKTLEELKTQSTYKNWDFENIWNVDLNTKMPALL